MYNLKQKIMKNVNAGIIQNEMFSVAEVQLVYKSKVSPSLRPKITSSRDAYSILKSLWNENTIELHEEFKVLLLNRANRVLAVYDVSSGGVAGTVADPKLIFIAALRGLASSIIIAHNHPSGNLRPSQQDIDLTKKIREGGKLLEIQVSDHIIVTNESYYSFADEGMM
jgi:DNA repair protein RadC